MRVLRDYLEDLQDEVEMVARFTQDGKTAFLADDRSQYAVMMAYARIGEIVKHIPNDILDTQPQIAWRDIKGFRDVLLHRYFDINIERVWQSVEQLPALKDAVQALLDSFPADEEDTP